MLDAIRIRLPEGAMSENNVNDKGWDDQEPEPKALSDEEKKQFKTDIANFYTRLEEYRTEELNKGFLRIVPNYKPDRLGHIKAKIISSYGNETRKLYNLCHNYLKGKYDLASADMYNTIIYHGYFFKFIDNQGIDMTDISTTSLQNLNKYYRDFKQGKALTAVGGSILFTYWVPISLILCIIVLLFLIYTIYTAPKKYYNVRIKNEN